MTTETILTRAAARIVAYGLLHPRRRKPHRTPRDFGIEQWETRKLTTADGKKLACWILPGGDSRVAVVGHGIGLSRSASLGQAAFLNERGYTVVMFDHRNHGRSSRDLRTWQMAARFTLDIEACVSWLRERHPGSATTVTVFGFSFSTFPSFYAVARGRTAIDAVVCDSGPGLTLESLFEGFMRTGGFPTIPGFTSPAAVASVKRATASAAVRMLGADWPPNRDAGSLGETDMMFMVGRDDPVITPREVEALAERYDRVQAKVINGGHLKGYKVDRAGYLAALGEFLDVVEARGSGGVSVAG